MAPLAKELVLHRTVYVPDLPGFGRSDKPDRALDVPELADCLASWMGALGLGPAALIGNSFGCQVVVELAVRHPGLVERAVLQAPVVDPRARTAPQQFARWTRTLPYDSLSILPLLAHAYLTAGIPRAVRTVRYMLRYPIERRLTRVGVPTLVVRGDRDPIVPQRWAEEASRLPPRGELTVIPGAAHAIPYNQPLELARASLAFLNGEEEYRSSR